MAQSTRNRQRLLARASKRELPDRPACWSWRFPERSTTIDDLFLWHAGRCAVCGKVANTVVDHDHKTMLVRGALCGSCNVRESRHDGVFAHYRAIYPAYILDIKVRWVPPTACKREDPFAAWRHA